MAINQQQYQLRFEKLRKQGLSVEESHSKAMKFATIKTKQIPKGDKLAKSPTTKAYEEYVKRVEKLGAKGTGIATREQFEVIQARLKRHPLARAVAGRREATTPDYATVRTEAVEGRLRQAGLTEEEIKRLRR